MPTTHPVLARLRAEAADGPIVVAHRGDSVNFPENTLAAFRAAHALGVTMQEFDVRMTRDGALVCVHDADLDRTTDAARRLGPGALVAQLPLARLQELDAGGWLHARHAGERMPTLAAALAAMAPPCVPMIEQKAGPAGAFVSELQRVGRLDDCILQSFDWHFVADAHALAPDLLLAVLGPNPAHARPDAAALAAARACGASILHWHDRELTRADVARAHDAGMLVCTYTTDDALGWAGGRALGFDAMCTNRPGDALRWRRER